MPHRRKEMKRQSDIQYNVFGTCSTALHPLKTMNRRMEITRERRFKTSVFSCLSILIKNDIVNHSYYFYILLSTNYGILIYLAGS